MIRQLKALVISHFKEFFREPEVIFWVFFFPIGLSWILGIAFDIKGENTRVIGVIENSNSTNATLHQLIQQAAARYASTPSKYFSAGIKNPFNFIFTDRQGALTALKQGKFEVFIELSVKNGKLLYYFDPKNSEARLTFLLLEKYFSPGESKGIESQPAPLVIPGSRYIDFLIPGLLAMEIMNSAMWGIGWSLIEFRSKKLLRRMAASPMNRNIFVLSHIIARLAFGIIEFLAIYLFALFYFKVKIQGSLIALGIVYISSIFAFGGMAMLFAARTASTRVGNGIINVITLPMMMLSGIFFSYHNFPDWAIPIIQLLPLALITDSIRSIFLEGTRIPQILVPSLALLTLGIIFISISLKIFKWY